MPALQYLCKGIGQINMLSKTERNAREVVPYIIVSNCRGLNAQMSLIKMARIVWNDLCIARVFHMNEAGWNDIPLRGTGGGRSLQKRIQKVWSLKRNARKTLMPRIVGAIIDSPCVLSDINQIGTPRRSLPAKHNKTIKKGRRAVLLRLSLKLCVAVFRASCAVCLRRLQRCKIGFILRARIALPACPCFGNGIAARR